jgi:hypothetical protein
VARRAAAWINCLRAKRVPGRQEQELFQKMFNYPAQCRFNDRKTTFNFTLREDGIQTNAGFYPWKVMKDYHWLGEAQEERVGIIGLSSLVNYDPLNPYRAAGIYIARIRLTRSQNRQRRLNLYVDPERVATFEKLCEQHGLPRLTRVRLFLFGTNPYPLIVFIRVVPQ